MLYNFANKQPYTMTLAIALVVLLAAAFIVTTVLRSKIMNEDHDKAETYKEIVHKAAIASFQKPSLLNKMGKVALKFQDPEYANEFARLNDGVVAE